MFVELEIKGSGLEITTDALQAFVEDSLSIKTLLEVSSISVDDHADLYNGFCVIVEIPDKYYDEFVWNQLSIRLQERYQEFIRDNPSKEWWER